MNFRAPELLPAIAIVLGLALGANGISRAASPQLAWNDEFNQPDGSGPDPTKWTYDLGVGSPVGWGNNELESYTNSRNNSVIVSDPAATDGKALAIIAQYTNGTYTSARLKTEGLYSFTYGRMEARLKLPTGQGLWPAFWALGTDITSVGWPQCGEMDVMEWGLLGAPTTQINQTTHWSANGTTADYGGTFGLPSGSTGDYHVYAVDWYPSFLIYSVDGSVVSTAKIAVGSIPAFSNPFFILLNLAVGGAFPGPPSSSIQFPQSYLVDYVRVYSLPTTPPTSQVWPPSPPQNLAVTAGTGSTASVSWQAPFSNFGAAVTGYVLERAGDSMFTQEKTSWNVAATSSSYQDATIVSGGTYYYRVSAVSSNGTSDPTAPVEAGTTAPTALVQPQSQTIAAGSSVVFGFSASGSPQYQWSLNGSPIQGATSGTLVVSSATAANAGTYYCVATNGSGTIQSANASLSVVTTSDPGRLVNLSARAQAGTGGNIIFGGFAIGGAGTSGSDRVLIRASGPAIAADPFKVPGTLPDPQLQLFDSKGAAIPGDLNNGWAGDTQIAATAAQVGAFAWNATTSHDAALNLPLQPGPYTAQVSGQSGDTGVALMEVYDGTLPSAYTPQSPRLVNLSARVNVASGAANALFAGFVIHGSTSLTVLIRASGPAIAADPFKVPGTLADPELTLKDQTTGATLATNAGWGGNAQIASAAANVGAFAWSNPSSHDSAILVTLPPGNYAAVADGSSGGAGVTLVEVYEVP